MTDGSRVVTELVGVYHADGGVLGELRYAVGRLTGRAHCALCDITHAGVRRRPQWDDLVLELGVPFRLVHLNERQPDVALASGTATPCVLARTPDGLVMLLTPAGLDEAGADVARFGSVLRAALAATDLHLGA